MRLRVQPLILSLVLTLKFLLTPGSLGLLALAMLIGLAARRAGGRLARAGTVWIAVWIGAYVVLSMPAVADRLVMSLASVPPFEEGSAHAGAAVIVLGGGAERYTLGDEKVYLMNAGATLRVLEAARVYRLLDAPVVIVSGMSERHGRLPEVEAMREALIRSGVPAERVVAEADSLNTRGSAVAAGALLRARGLSKAVLVTSATHIPRAMRAFQAAGVAVIAAPAPVPGSRRRRGWRAWVPSLRSLDVSESCLYERAGSLYYQLRGWI